MSISDLQSSSQRSSPNTVSVDCLSSNFSSLSLPLPLSPFLCILFDFVTLHIVCWNWSGRRIVQIVAEHWTLNWYAAYISIHVYKVTLDLIHSSHCFLSISFLLFYFRFFSSYKLTIHVCIRIEIIWTQSEASLLLSPEVWAHYGIACASVCTQINCGI